MKNLNDNQISFIAGGRTCCNDTGTTGDKFLKARSITASMPPYFYSAVIGCIYSNSSYSFKGDIGIASYPWVECTAQTPSIVQCMCYNKPCCSS